MTPAHHPPDDLLLDHVTGALPLPPRLVVDLHLSRCEHCSRTAAMLTEVGGVLLDQAPPTPTAPRVLAEALRRAAQPSDAAGTLRPESLEGWGAGRRIRTLAKGDRWRTYLLEAQGGTRLPAHHHRGREFTCVLAGRLEDEHGSYGAGDFLSGGLGPHRVRVPRGEPCRAVLAVENGFRLAGMLKLLSFTFRE